MPYLALFGLAAVLRVASVLWVDREGFVLNDALLHHETAVSLTRGDGYRPPFNGPTAQWPPGDATALAGVDLAFDTAPLAGKVFNAPVGAATVLLLVLLVERVVDRRAAIVAGLIMAVLPGPILWTDVLVAETLYTALFLLFLLVPHPTGAGSSRSAPSSASAGWCGVRP